MATNKPYDKKKSGKLPVGIIVGGALGGAAVVAIVVVLIFHSGPRKAAFSEDSKPSAAPVVPPRPRGLEHAAAAKGSEPFKRPGEKRASAAASAAGPAMANVPKLDQPVERMQFSPRGDHFFAAAVGQKRGRLWAFPSWRETKASAPECDYFSVPAAFSPGGEFIACQDGPMLRIWNIAKSPAALVNSVPVYRPDADDTSWNGVFWATDGTLVTRNPQGGFQFLGSDPDKGAVLTKSVGSGAQGRLQVGNRQFSTDIHTPGTISIKDVAIAPNGLAFGVLGGDGGKPGFHVWLIPSAQPAGFVPFDVPDEGKWECRGITISPDGSQLAASMQYSAGKAPSRTIYEVALWRGAPPKKMALDLKEKNLVDFRFRGFSPDGWKAVTSGATSVHTADGDVVKRFVTAWDTASGQELWQADDVFTEDVFFTKDGRTLVTGGAGGSDPNSPQTVDFWDVETHQRRCQFKDSGIDGLAVSPDGTALVTAYSRAAGGREFAGEQGSALAVHLFPANRQSLSDEDLERDAKERRQKFISGGHGEEEPRPSGSPPSR